MTGEDASDNYLSAGFFYAHSSSDKTIKVWDVAERQCLHTFQDYADQVWGVAFDRTGTKLVGISDDQSIRIHECPAA